MAAVPMAKALAALYLVGTITSNPKRAAVTRTVSSDDVDSSQSLQHSVVPSGLENESVPAKQLPGTRPGLRRGLADFTLPMPLVRR